MSDPPPPSDPRPPSEPPPGSSGAPQPPEPSPGPSDAPPPPGPPPQSAPQGEPFYSDLAPHRGVLILILGIASIVCGGLGGICCAIFAVAGILLGIFAWVFGNADAVKMADGVMDPTGKGLTDAGKICGIVGTIISAISVVLGIAMTIFFLVVGISEGRF